MKACREKKMTLTAKGTEIENTKTIENTNETKYCFFHKSQ